MKKSNLVVIGITALLVVGLVGAGIKVSRNNVVAGGEGVPGNVVTSPEDQTLGSGTGEYVTYSELELGPGLSAPLKFVRGNTTTPGGLVKILNTGSAKLCGRIEVDITDGTATGGETGVGTAISLTFSTSTLGTSFSTKSGGLIASTTIATGTPELITSVRFPGTYIGADQDIGGESWIWGKGVWLLGAFDDRSKASGGADQATSSAAYTGMAGRMYTECHVRN